MHDQPTRGITTQYIPNSDVQNAPGKKIKKKIMQVTVDYINLQTAY